MREKTTPSSRIGEITIRDQTRNKGFAAPRCRQCIELARTAPVAIAARKLFTCDTPSDLRRFARVLLLHVTPPSNQGMSHSGCFAVKVLTTPLSSYPMKLQSGHCAGPFLSCLTFIAKVV